ncbi:MAG: lipocalin family protein [Bacteroidales bacterium]|nr:lipocalin family protein [Bacteroidales bacterium]
MMIKRLIILAVAALALVGCKGHGDDPVKALDVTGEWELTSIVTRSASIGGTPIAVYINFTAEKTFDLYQKIGEGRYTHFKGTYQLSGESLSGTYDNGKTWGSVYTVAIEGDQMTLTTTGGTEADTYRKTTIPQSVKENVY